MIFFPCQKWKQTFPKYVLFLYSCTQFNIILKWNFDKTTVRWKNRINHVSISAALSVEHIGPFPWCEKCASEGHLAPKVVPRVLASADLTIKSVSSKNFQKTSTFCPYDTGFANPVPPRVTDTRPKMSIRQSTDDFHGRRSDAPNAPKNINIIRKMSSEKWN